MCAHVWVGRVCMCVGGVGGSCVCMHVCVCVWMHDWMRGVERKRERLKKACTFGDDVLYFFILGSQTLVPDRIREALQMAGLV